MKRLLILIVSSCAVLFFAARCYAAEPQVSINEFLPNPVGDDAVGEWVELYNSGSETVTLNGWVLSDIYGTVKNFTLDGKSIAAGGFLLIYRSESGITMNNDTEQLQLTSPQGMAQTTAIVSNPVEGKSYALHDGTWVSGIPTPGEQNDPQPSPFPSPAFSPAMSPSPSPSSSPTSIPIQNIMLSEVLACGATTEWVELYNPNATQVFLDDWKLQDSTSQSKSFDGMSISPKGYIVKEWAGYFLNNGGDEVRLFHGDDLVDAFSYENCATGFTWARKGESWLQTSHSTKGQENIVMFESLPSPSAFQSTNLQEQVPLTSTTNGASVSAEAALPLKSKLFDPALIPQLKSTTPSQQSNLISEQLALPSHYRSTNPDPPSTFAWFISAGFWFIAAACAFVSNATMNHVLTIT